MRLVVITSTNQDNKDIIFFFNTQEASYKINLIPTHVWSDDKEKCLKRWKELNFLAGKQGVLSRKCMALRDANSLGGALKAHL